MSRVSSASILAAIASVSLGGCATRGAGRGQQQQRALSPSNMYQLCNDVRFQCLPADLQTHETAAPIQIDTNLTAPARQPDLG